MAANEVQGKNTIEDADKLALSHQRRGGDCMRDSEVKHDEWCSLPTFLVPQ